MLKRMMGAILFTVLCLTSFNLFAAINDPEGVWTSIDDRDGQPRSIVQISESNGIYSGHILKVFPRPGDTGFCRKCPPPFRDKPTKGLGIIWNIRQTGNNEWSGGRILDPKSGSIYRLKLSLADGGRRMNVRGYIGISLLGRTQTWLRKN